MKLIFLDSLQSYYLNVENMEFIVKHKFKQLN